MNLLSPQLKKLLTSSIAILSVLGYGVFVFAAQLPDGTPPPVGGYALGGDTILDPGCAPGTANCIVRPGWVFDTTNDYLYTTTEKVGIGTDTPTHDLTNFGDTFLMYQGGSTSLFTQGNLQDFGGDEGFSQFVMNDTLNPTSIGSSMLNFNGGHPTYALDISNSVNHSFFEISSNPGLVSIGALDSNGIGSSLELGTIGVGGAPWRESIF